MFTGLVEQTGKLRRVDTQDRGRRLVIETLLSQNKGIDIGDSLAVNGICLTVVQVESTAITVEAGFETLTRTTLGEWAPGRLLNLERAMRADGRWGGHFVTGHIDATGRIVLIRPTGLQTTLGIALPSEILSTVVEKGSIAIDGVSLTVAAVRGSTIEIAVIPHTWQNTVCHTYRVQERVNVETDLIGKYVAAFVRRNRGT